MHLLMLWLEALYGKSPTCQAHWPNYGSGEVMFLICHGVSQDHVTLSKINSA